MAAAAALAAVAAAAAAGILVVGGRVAVIAAAARIAGRASSVRAVGIAFDPAVEQRSVIGDVGRGAGNAFALGCVSRPRRQASIVRAGRIVRPSLDKRAATAEAEAGRVEYPAGEGQAVGDVDGEHASRRAVPGKRVDGARDRGVGILRHPDHLEGALADRVGRRGGDVRIEEAAAGAADDGQRSPAHPDGARRTDEFVKAGLADGAVAVGVGPRGAAAIRAVVVRVDRCALHLDDQQHVADRDRGGGAARRPERDRVRPRSGARSAGEIGVDHPGRSAVAVRPGPGALLRHGGGGKHRHQQNGQEEDSAAHRRPIPRLSRLSWSNLKRIVT